MLSAWDANYIIGTYLLLSVNAIVINCNREAKTGDNADNN